MTAAWDDAGLLPIRQPHVLMSFFMFSANLGDPCAVTPAMLVSRPIGRAVLAALQALYDLVDPACRNMDPIVALDALAKSKRHRLIPLTHLFAPFARAGYPSPATPAPRGRGRAQPQKKRQRAAGSKIHGISSHAVAMAVSNRPSRRILFLYPERCFVDE